MDSSSIGRAVSLIILVILSAFFSSAETALTTVNVHRLRALAEDGNKKAERVLKLKENSQKLYGTGTRWEEIYEANREIIRSPHWIYIGQVLTIPAA